MKPVISIIVPVYNTEVYLPECIDSILAQTFKEFELILVNDGSPDNSGTICDDYARQDSRIVVIHKKNGGVSSARNAGLDAAKGDFIGWVDSDDYIAPDMYELLYNLIIEYEADISECSYYSVFKNSLTKGGYGKGTEWGEGDFLLDKYLNEDIYYGLWSKLFRKTIFHSFRFPYPIHLEDALFSLYFCLGNYKFVRTDVAMYYYRQTENSIVRSKLNSRKAREYIYLLENKLTIINKHINNKFLRNSLLAYTMRISVFWYLGLALSDEKKTRQIYAKLYHKRMKYSIFDCLTSSNIPIRNKISYILCRLHLTKFAIFLKQITSLKRI